MDCTMDSSYFGARLKSEIDRLGIDGHQFAIFTGMSTSSLGHLLQRKSSPTSEIIKKLSLIPKINMAYIKDGVEAKKSGANVPVDRYEAAAQLLTNLPLASFEPFASALTAVYQPFLPQITGAPTESSSNRKPGYSFGLRLRSERERIGLSQVDIGRACGFPAASVSNWERGKYLPHGEAITKMFENTDLDVPYIITGVRTLKITAEEEALIERLRRIPRPIRLAAYALVAKAADSI